MQEQTERKRRLSWRGGLIGLALAAALIALAFWLGRLRQTNPEPRVQPTAAVAQEPQKPKDTRINVKKPEHVRGIYLTAWGAGSKRKMDNVIAMLKRTELNALVIDIRDAGSVYWKTGIEIADKSGATKVAVLNPEELMKRLEKENIYPIARIACFRDVFAPKAFPERAVKKEDGSLWKDTAGYTWLDPYNKKNWEYLSQVVEFALDLGFPEIQLDYVRFPSEGTKVSMVFPAKKEYEKTNASRTDVIAAFAEHIGKIVRERNAVYSADIFGIVSSSPSDQGIGQSLEQIAAPFDLICPMVYPSHFAKGEYGIKDPSSSPHAIVSKSLRDYARRLPNKKIRPWLQDFFGYGVQQVQAQIKACKEQGYNEYLLWNARNKYTEAAVVDTSKLVKPAAPK